VRVYAWVGGWVRESVCVRQRGCAFVCVCECVKVSVRVSVCGREIEGEGERECVRMCVYEREKVCVRDRGYVCDFVHAKMSVRVCLCLCVSI